MPIVHEAYDESKSLNDVLSATFTNMSNYTQFASMGLAVNVAGQATSAALVSVMAPVPEADSMLLVGAGMGVLAFLLRRRRSI